MILAILLLCYGSVWPSDVTGRGVATARTEAYARQLATCAAKDDGQRQCGDKAYRTDEREHVECEVVEDGQKCTATTCGSCVEQ